MGYHQSVRPCQTGLFLNIDASCAPFYKPMPVLQFFKEVLGLNSMPNRLHDQQLPIVRGIIKNLTVCQFLKIILFQPVSCIPHQNEKVGYRLVEPRQRLTCSSHQQLLCVTL